MLNSNDLTATKADKGCSTVLFNKTDFIKMTEITKK